MTLQINLPDSLKDFVEAQTIAGGYGSPGDYVLALLREVQKRQAWDRVETLILEGLDSGTPVEATPEWWAEKRLRLQKRFPETTGT